MNNIINFISNQIENLIWYKINLCDKKTDFPEELQNKINSKTNGIYFIRTNASNNELIKCENKSDDGNKKDLKQVIVYNKKIIDSNFAIKQINENDMYIVYNGQGTDILQRIGAHIRNQPNKDTGCLALNRFSNLKEYDWEIAFIIEDDKGMRIFIEQAFRAIYGWPILCYQ